MNLSECEKVRHRLEVEVADPTEILTLPFPLQPPTVPPRRKQPEKNPMGDRSPKANQKQKSQQQAKASSSSQKKQQATAAKQVVAPKKK